MPAAPTPPIAPGSTETGSRIVVMIFSDLVGSTALPAKFGATAYNAALRMHNESFERLAAEEGVTVVKFTGDGYFAWCPSAAGAVRFALRFQQAMRDMAWGEVVLAARLGIHLGEVSDITAAARTDLIGSAANLASRIMSVGLGGQILLSRAPFDEGRLHVSAHPLVRSGGSGEVPALEWLAHGPYRFNGYEEPIEVFEVGAKNLAPLVPPPDAEKAKRVLRPGDEETLGWRPAEGLEIPGRTGWRIAEKLGAGGFGEVWAGQHAKTRERRAFKFCFDAARLRALKREVTLTRLLRETLGEREDIVRIFDLRLDAPPYFLESELAADGNLLQWAERQGGLVKIPLDARLELVAATATALAAAHSVGVLHKDIKPTNVLIFSGKDGHVRPRLVDFGIGALADSAVLVQHGITGAGFTGATLQHSTGTPTYSAPEYLAGKPFTVQGDVYSLGVMLWQLVTGKADAPFAEGWQRDVSDPLLREDIALCADGDPARRLASAAELATRIRALPERRAAVANRAAAAAADLARHERQRRLRLTTAVATLIAAIAIPLAVWAMLKQREAEQEKTNAQEQARLAKMAGTKAEAERRRATDATQEAAAAALAANAERERAVGLIRFMDIQVSEAFTDGPIQLRERMSDRLDAFYRSQGEPATEDERQRRMGHHFRKAKVALAAAVGYEDDKSFNEASKKYFAKREREIAMGDLKEALRYGDLLAVIAPDDRRITRDRILAHCQISSVSSLLKDEQGAESHLRAAREMLDAVANNAPTHPK